VQAASWSGTRAVATLAPSSGLLAAVTLGLALRLWWLATSRAVPVSDAAGYREIALSIAAGDGFSMGGSPTAWWVPGWPFFMAILYRIFGPHDEAIYAANLLLGLATVLLTYALGRRLLGQSVGLWAAVAVAVYPGFVLLPRFLLTENLAIPWLLAVSLLCIHFQRVRRPLLAGLSVGLACGALILIREQMLPVVAAVALFWLVRRVSWTHLARLCAGLAAGTFLVIAPWVMRNEAVVGVPWLATTSGINLYVAFNPTASGGWADPPYQTWTTGTGRSAEAEQSAYGRGSALRYLAEYPLQAVAPAPTRLAIFLFDERWAVYWD
jgi:4-amino-4-deoxy-L-arabinose transferase-like glycosyltransferase